MATRLRHVFTNLIAVLDKFRLPCTKLDARGWVLAIRYFLHDCYIIRPIQYLTTPMSGFPRRKPLARVSTRHDVHPLIYHAAIHSKNNVMCLNSRSLL